MHNLGHTRSASQRDHILQTPDIFVRIPLPGLANAAAIVHIGPPAGAEFTLYTVEFEPNGSLQSNDLQHFVYVLEGEVTMQGDGRAEALVAGSYAYLPALLAHHLSALKTARVVVIERDAKVLSDASAPGLLISHEDAVSPVPLLGDPDIQVRTLPGDANFNFAVNTMTYQPGATLPMV